MIEKYIVRNICSIIKGEYFAMNRLGEFVLRDGNGKQLRGDINAGRRRNVKLQKWR